MVSMSMLMNVSCAVVLLVVLLAPVMEVEAVTCGQVVSDIAPCLGYLRSGGAPPQLCCNGIRRLRNQARNTGDRKTICNCLKSASSSYRGIHGSSGVHGYYTASLPRKCGINVPYKINIATDCNRI